MRLAGWTVAVLIAAGCRRAAPEPPVIPEEPVVEPERPLLVGPGTWADPAALPLRVTLPVGWEAWRGRDPGEVARLMRRPGVEIRLLALDTDEPRRLPDCAWVSHDRIGRHRDVPALGEAGLATCKPLEPDGFVVFAWIGSLEGRSVHAELHLGPGELVAGRDEAAAVLGSMTAISAADGEALR